MNAICPHCNTVFRIDPAKVPRGGVRARCSICRAVFPVGLSDSSEAPVLHVQQPSGFPVTATRFESATALGEASYPVEHERTDAAVVPERIKPAFGFGHDDPDAKARRLARALVSDIVTYHPERRARAMDSGTLKREFREEIRKSWEEYVGQVGADAASGTPHFRDALNDLLAGGRPVF